MPTLPSQYNVRSILQYISTLGLRHWLLLALLSGCAAWLTMHQGHTTRTTEEELSMVSAKADYYLESFTLLSTDTKGSPEFDLRAESLIHLPDEELARIDNPSLTVKNSRENEQWEISANSGLMPDTGQTVELLGDVLLLQSVEQQHTVRLNTEALTLDQQSQLLRSEASVDVSGQGWELSADSMRAEIETGKLIFRENSHVRYGN